MIAARLRHRATARVSMSTLEAELKSAIASATDGAWRLAGLEATSNQLLVSVQSDQVNAVIEVQPASNASAAYKTIGDFAFSYRGRQLPTSAAVFDRILAGLAVPIRSRGLPEPRTSANVPTDVDFPTPYQRAELDRPIAMSREQIRRFRETGHVLVRQALHRDVLIAARPAMLKAIRSAPPEASPTQARDGAYSAAFKQVTDLARDNAAMRTLVFSRRILQVAADLLGVDALRLFCEDWLIKPPGAAITPWHQDGAVFPFEADTSITCWIPFQDIAADGGLMRFASRSHTLPLAEIEDINDQSEQFFERTIDERALTVDTMPTISLGDISFHHGKLIHGALANRTDQTRFVLALHCFEAGARIQSPRTENMTRLLKNAAPLSQPGDPAASPRWPIVYERHTPVRSSGGESPEQCLHFRATLLPSGAEPVDMWVARGSLQRRRVPGARTIASEGFVCSGLVDCHSHISYPNDTQAPVETQAWMNARRAEYAQTGVLLLRDMGAVGNEIANLTDVPGLPRVQASGNMVLRYDEFPFTRTEPGDLVEACLQRIRSGTRWVKIFADWTTDYRGRVNTGFRGDDPLTYPVHTLRKAVQAVHARGGRVAAHCFTRAGAEASIRAGVDSLEHGWGLDEPLLEAMAQQSIAWAPLVGIATSMWRTARREKQPERMQWIADRMSAMERTLPQAVHLGVQLLAGTDMFPTVSVADEVEQLHALGVNDLVAAGAGAWDARSWLGEYGIEDGAPADLVFFARDPRKAVGVLQRPTTILSGGVVVQTQFGESRPRYRPWSERDAP